LSAAEDKKEDTNEFIDKDTLLWGTAVTAGAAFLLGVGSIFMGWMKDQDQEKKRIELQKQQQIRQQVALELQQRNRQQQDQGWPNPIPRNTIPQKTPVMELPSDTIEDDTGHFISPTAYNTNEQKFVVSDDIVNTHRYPTIDPNAPTQQIGNKISRVMSLDDTNPPQRSPPPPPIRTNMVGDDEDISDLFNS